MMEPVHGTVFGTPSSLQDTTCTTVEDSSFVVCWSLWVCLASFYKHISFRNFMDCGGIIWVLESLGSLSLSLHTHTHTHLPTVPTFGEISANKHSVSICSRVWHLRGKFFTEKPRLVALRKSWWTIAPMYHEEILPGVWSQSLIVRSSEKSTQINMAPKPY